MAQKRTWLSLALFAWRGPLLLADAGDLGADVSGKADCDKEAYVVVRDTGDSMVCPNGCPYAVASLKNVCEIRCVTSVADCAGVNPHRPLIRNGSHTCEACTSRNCKSCSAVGVDGDVCLECFDGFQLQDGACTVQYESVVFFVAEVLSLLAVAGICALLVGTWWILWHFKLAACNVYAYAKRKCSLSVHSVDSPELSEPFVAMRDAHSEVLDNAERQSRHNARVIMHGLALALKARIVEMSKQKVLELGSADVVGVGLPVFYNTQLFLIVVSVTVYVIVASVEKFSEVSVFFEWLHSDDRYACQPEKEAVALHYVRRYAVYMGVACAAMWVLLFFMSTAFVASQIYYVRKFDREHISMEDYALVVKGLPVNETSEDKLRRDLGKILPSSFPQVYGVSIIYDVEDFNAKLKHLGPKLSALTGVDVDRVPSSAEDMIEHMVELDDLANDWVEDDISTGSARLHEVAEIDKATMRHLLEQGELKSTGEAFLVFQRQEEVQLLAKTTRGIVWGTGQEAQILPLNEVCHGPASVRWLNFLKPRRIFHRDLALMTLRMLCLLGLFAFVSHGFFEVFVAPFDKADLKPDQNSATFLMVGLMLGGGNAVIQLVVFAEAYAAGFQNFTSIDRAIFIGNTVLMAITIAYQLIFFSYRRGVSFVLSSADSHSLLEEADVARTILVILVPGPFFVQYVLNELATCLTPPLLGHLALRAVYVWNIGPKWLQRLVVDALLGSQSDVDVITAREAERAQDLQELLLSLEYTWAVVLPAATFVLLFFVTDCADTLCMFLVVFAVFFFAYQRFVNMHMLRKAPHESSICFVAFAVGWGFVLSMPAAAAAWWSWRAGLVSESFGTLVAFGAYGVALLIYLIVLDYIGCFYDDEPVMDDEDADVRVVMDNCQCSWWNMNPIYVLKSRHCPDVAGYECHDGLIGKKRQVWPHSHARAGFLEFGKEYRHVRRTSLGASLCPPTPSLKLCKTMSFCSRDIEEGDALHGCTEVPCCYESLQDDAEHCQIKELRARLCSEECQLREHEHRSEFVEQRMEALRSDMKDMSCRLEDTERMGLAKAVRPETDELVRGVEHSTIFASRTALRNKVVTDCVNGFEQHCVDKQPRGDVETSIASDSEDGFVARTARCLESVSSLAAAGIAELEECAHSQEVRIQQLERQLAESLSELQDSRSEVQASSDRERLLAQNLSMQTAWLHAHDAAAHRQIPPKHTNMASNNSEPVRFSPQELRRRDSGVDSDFGVSDRQIMRVISMSAGQAASPSEASSPELLEEDGERLTFLNFDAELQDASAMAADVVEENAVEEVIEGSSSYEGSTHDFLSDGSIDEAFGNLAKHCFHEENAVEKVIEGSSSSEGSTHDFLSDGSIDEAFGNLAKHCFHEVQETSLNEEGAVAPFTSTPACSVVADEL